MLKSSVRSLLNDSRVRYLLAGGINMAFGYSVSLGVYYVFQHVWHIVAIGILANILGITFSYVTYKLFVFKTKGNWISEYFRCYLVYGASALLGVVAVWFMVDGLKWAFWISQLATTILTVFFIYLGHVRFTFFINKM